MSKKLEQFLEQTSKDLQKNKYFIGGLVGGIIGAGSAAKGERSARDAMSEALGRAASIRVPTIEEQRIKLEMLQSMGVLTPEMEQAIQQDPSKFNEILEDPALREVQMGALEKLKQQESGLNAEDRAALNQIRASSAQQERASRDAILQNMAARGMGGSGSELAAQLAASQGAATNASAQGDALAAMASKRAAEAVMNRAQMAGNVRQQDFGVASDKARAMDAINQFNTQLSSGREQRNVGTRNVAQEANLGNKQRIADTNVNLKNQQEIHNKGLYQQQFQNEMAKTGMVNQAGIAGGQLAQDQGYNRAAMYSGIGSGVDKAATSIYAMSDENSKKDVEPADGKLERFLKEVSVSLKKYNMGGSVGSTSDAAAFADEMKNLNFNTVADGKANDTSLMPQTSGKANAPIAAQDEDKIKQFLASNAEPTQLFNQSPRIQQVSAPNVQMARASDFQPISTENPFNKKFAHGGMVEGDAPHDGDHEENDVVPAALSPGEIVIPRSAVKKGRPGIDEFLNNLEAKEYTYKDKENGEGRHISPMAQDLEKSEVGKQMVIDTPKGKMVDYGKGFGTLLASQAMLSDKIKEIEKRLKIGKK